MHDAKGADVICVSLTGRREYDMTSLKLVGPECDLSGTSSIRNSLKIKASKMSSLLFFLLLQWK